MAIRKITFDNSNVTAQDDSSLYYFLTNESGILDGIKNECQVSNNANRIIFKSGYVSIYGRMVYISDNTDITIPLDKTAYGYVIIEVNTNLNSVALKFKEGTSSYPGLTQEDLNATGSLYEFALCKYSKTIASLTLDKSFVPIKVFKKLSVKNEVKNKDKLMTINANGFIDYVNRNEVHVLKATQDAKGNVIDTTYATKVSVDKLNNDLTIELNKKANSSDVYKKTETYNRTEVDNKDTNTLNSAKSYTDTQLKTIIDNIVKDVICSHQYEITGNTGDEHGLAVEDQQMLIKKIEGQTKVVNGQLVNSNCVLKSTGRNLIDISKPTSTMANIYATENSIIYNGSKALTKMAVSLFNKQEQYKDYFVLNGFKGCKVTQENNDIIFAFYTSETEWHIAKYDVSHLAGFTIYVMATENLSAKTFSDIRIVYQKTPYEPFKEDTIDGIGSLGQWDYDDLITQKGIRATSQVKIIDQNTNFERVNDYFVAYNILENASESYDNNNNNNNRLTPTNWNILTQNQVDNCLATLGHRVAIRINSITTKEQLKQWLAQNPIQLVYKKATPTIVDINLPNGMAVYNGGLQSQIGDVPYKITKQYNLSQKAQTLANIEIDREQQALIDNLENNTYNKNEVDNKVEIINNSITDNVNSLNNVIGLKANQTDVTSNLNLIDFILDNVKESKTILVKGYTSNHSEGGPLPIYKVTLEVQLPKNLENNPTCSAVHGYGSLENYNYDKATGLLRITMNGPELQFEVRCNVSYITTLRDIYNRKDQVVEVKEVV